MAVQLNFRGHIFLVEPFCQYQHRYQYIMSWCRVPFFPFQCKQRDAETRPRGSTVRARLVTRLVFEKKKKKKEQRSSKRQPTMLRVNEKPKRQQMILTAASRRDFEEGRCLLGAGSAGTRMMPEARLGSRSRGCNLPCTILV